MKNEDIFRPLYLCKILYERTDEEHSLSTVDLIRILSEEYGISTHRQTIKNDLNVMREFGMDIEEVRSSQNQYKLLSRTFETAELKLMIDAVFSAKFIPLHKRAELSEKIASLTSGYRSEVLKEQIETEKQTRQGNDQIFYIIDRINEAISQKKKISFQYLKYNSKKQQGLRHNGERYAMSPYGLTWNGDNYYVVGYSDKHKAIGSFRVDRIAKAPTILKATAKNQPVDFSVDAYVNSMLRMYDSKRERVFLRCSNEVIDSIIDKFGEEIDIVEAPDDTFRTTIETAVNHVFFSWVFGFEGKVKIEGPSMVRERYCRMVKNEADSLS